ncbi:MAG TPA: ATP-binding cassette domain-containing protein [Gammaproteobacteria bacterium]|jgi:ABC-2 type transport system ATP-binding protein|nr:ATP-binding cassette domain-containing protein [Gammaproteobacteria bacterium]
MSDDALVSADNIYRYYGQYCAVENLRLRLQRGEVLGLLGPNGAGKSSTLQMLSGNLAPSAGQITINGIDLLDAPKRAKAHIGYLPEHPPLYPDFTVDEYLRYCGRLHGIPRARVKPAVDEVKVRCGLSETGRRLIGNLSKGYQQRVGVAQALIHSPLVIILDEPTVGLDPIQIREIRALIRVLGKSHGVILSTHILPEVQAVCDRVQIIHAGRTVFNDSLSGLDKRHGPKGLIVAFRSPPAMEALRALPGVESIEPLASGRVRIVHKGVMAVDAVVKASVESNWGLQELTPERTTLEQIFMDLVHREQDTEAQDNAIARAAS